MDFSVSMALVDYIPVILYIISAVIMQRTLYGRMVTGGFAVYSSGTIMVATAGIFKATWKLLYALGVCDFVALNKCFMPMQATGFMLSGIAMIGFVFSKHSKPGEKLAVSATPAAFTSNMPFVFFMAFGVALTQFGYAVLAARKKRIRTVIVFFISFVLLMMMGYLSSKDFSKAIFNWIGEIVNTLAMVTQLIGIIDLKKHAFEN